MVVVQSGAGAARRVQNQKRAAAMSKKKKQREAALRIQIDKWFEQFDTDGSSTLEREELRALLSHINPDHPPDDEVLDVLMEKGKRDIAGNSISKEATMRTVQKFNTYLKDRDELDTLFEEFDKDKSGVLEQSELLAVLCAFAPSVLPTEGAHDLESHCRRCLTAAEACADDVIFVLEHCDTDGDRTIDRDELLPMLAEWKARHRLPVLCRCPLRSAPLCHLHDPLCP